MRFLASHSQRRILFFEQRNPGSPAHCVPRQFDLSGDVDLDVLGDAFAEVARRHQGLRLRFEYVDGETWAVVVPPCRCEILRLEDGLTPDQADGQLMRYVRMPFDTQHGPLFRICAAKLGQSRWRILLVLHHTCVDDISVRTVVRDWAAAYEHIRSRHDAAPAAPESSSYDLFTSWEREFVASPSGRAAISALALDLQRGEPTSLAPGGVSDGSEDGRISLAIPEATMRAVEGLARLHRCTSFMVFCAAFSVLLSRYTGDEDILFGVAIGNRRIRELGEGVGDFVNTVPVRTTVEGRRSFLECLFEARRALMRGLQYGAAPIDLVVQAAGRSGQGDPVQVVLLENLEAPTLNLSGVNCTTSRPWTGASKVDLQVSVERSGAGRRIYVEFRNGRIGQEMAQRLAHHLVAILSAASAAPSDEVGAISLLSSDDLDQVMSMSHGVPVAQASAPVHWEFLEQCRLRPDHVAIVANEEGRDRTLSYGELEQWSRRVAAEVARSSTIGGPVGVICQRSPALSAAVLGLLRAGRVYFPLDPDYPDERLAWMLNEAEPTLILAGRGLAGRACLANSRVVCIEDLEPDAAPEEAVDVLVDPSAPAYLLYTSGSTGRPKGVVNTHVGLRNRLEWMQAAYTLSCDDVVLHKTPISFDVSVWELIWPLMYGARMILAAPGGHRDPTYLCDLIERTRVTVAHFVPSMLRLFLQEVGAERCDSIRHLICSGEALASDLVDAWLVRPDRAMHNLYGPTEAAIDVTAWCCATNAADAFAPIGKPIQNTCIFVLDRQQRLLPVGAVGEIYIGGPNVALGYLKQPELTAERFVSLSVDRRLAPVRLYRTGDLGRLREDGAFVYCGRMDEQVKVNGVRVELGEIEALLRQNAAVADAAVTLQHDPDGERFLVAYIVGEGDATHLEHWLGERLPAAVIPHAYVHLQALPRTHSGKIDRKALPRLDRTRRMSDKQFAAPRDEQEEVIAGIWKEVLRRDRIGIDDDFFSIGGDSMRSLRVATRMRAVGLSATVTDILSARTIRQLAQRAGGALPAEHERSPTGDLFAAPRLINTLWLNSQVNPSYRAYLTSYRLRTKWDEKAMLDVLQRAVDRHPMLRSSLVIDGAGRAHVRVNTQVSVEAEIHRLDDSPESEQKEVMSAFFDTEAKRTWPWERQLSCRFVIHLLSSREIQFTIIEPWLDGWSVKTLAEEVLQDYGRKLEGLPNEAETLALPPYADFADAEIAALDSPGHRAFWTQRLADMGTSLVAGGRDATEMAHFDVPLGNSARRAREVASAIGVPLKHFLMAAHMAVVSAVTGRAKVTSGVMFNGRSEVAGADKVLGLYLNALPIGADIRAKTWAEVARRCLDEEIAISRWRHFPSDELRRIFGEPIFDVLFNFTDFSEMRVALGANVDVVHRVAFDQTYMSICAQFGVDLATGDIALHLEGDARVFDDIGRKRMAALYGQALEAACSAPNALVERWDPARDDQALLLEWGSGEPSTADEASIIELFHEQCRRVGERVCVIDGERTYSFLETNAEVERLAGALHQLGVRQDDVVGVCLDRSFESIVAVLAAVRLGAAFAPLPMDAPERRAFAIADAKVKVVVSRREAFGESGPEHWLDIESIRNREVLPPPPFERRSAHGALHVLYTSGSTGRPKGVETSESAVLNRLRWMWQLEPFSENEVMAQKTALSFVDSVWEIFGALLKGYPTCVVSDECAHDAVALSRAIEDGMCTRLTLVPSMADAMLHDEPALGDVLRRVRVLILSGEPLTERTAARLMTALPNARILNLYGSTETAGDATYRRVVCAAEAGLVGRPIAGSRVVVTDEFGRLSPAAVPGEIRVIGACLATRYVGRAASDAVEQGRWTTTPWGRAWSTGDIGLWRTDGTLAIMGRRDRQLKVRGVRIEPGEIESALLSVPGVRRAVAVSLPNKTLTAFVEGNGVAVDGLRRSLAAALPRAMVPGRIVVVNAFPQTLTGKIDTAKLIELHRGDSEDRPDDIPRTEAETLLASIWSDVFPTRTIARSSNFFELGGHSLLAGSIASRLRQRLKVRVPVRMIFENAVLADLALELERSCRVGSVPA